MTSFLRSVFLLVCTAILVLGCSEESELENVEAEDAYQLWMETSSINDKYVRLNLVDLFKQIALGSEYDNSFPITLKWRSTMRIYVGGTISEHLESELHDIISTINSLTTDGFRIEVVKDIVDSNFYIHLGDEIEFLKLYPQHSQLAQENLGFFSVNWNKQFEITSGHMFVNITKTVLDEQRHLLREELTQALGFPNDIPYYANSIFYNEWSRTNSYSEYDIEVIRLLYHPKVINGLSEDNVDRLLRQILGIR